MPDRSLGAISKTEVTFPSSPCTEWVRTLTRSLHAKLRRCSRSNRLMPRSRSRFDGIAIRGPKGAVLGRAAHRTRGAPP